MYLMHEYKSIFLSRVPPPSFFTVCDILHVTLQRELNKLVLWTKKSLLSKTETLMWEQMNKKE